jgi:hypothetical protein
MTHAPTTASTPDPPAAGPPTLPSLADQADRLVAAGVTALAGVDPAALHDAVARPGAPAGLLVLPAAAPSALAPLLRAGDRSGFVVEDMGDVDAFAPTPAAATPPDAAAYVLVGLDRGDAMANWSPEEALAAITGAGRTPLTLVEGALWALQVPGVLERNRCYMTIGARLRRPNGTYDARTPALWLSNGTGRDGRERRGAPKIGWCWWRNRHTWLGIASADARVPLEL